MEDYHHFVTGNFKSHADFLSNKDYAKVLDNIVISCIDCMIINKGRILLGKRTYEPQPDWWTIGGRMKPGESFEVAAARNVRREIGLNIEPSRFSYFSTYSFVWMRRAQTPKNHGSHTISIVMIVDISDIEAETIKLDKEFEKTQWIMPEDIIARSEKFHPGLVSYAKDLIKYSR